jgi:hypothetical protein
MRCLASQQPRSIAGPLLLLRLGPSLGGSLACWPCAAESQGPGTAQQRALLITEPPCRSRRGPGPGRDEAGRMGGGTGWGSILGAAAAQGAAAASQAHKRVLQRQDWLDRPEEKEEWLLSSGGEGSAGGNPSEPSGPDTSPTPEPAGDGGDEDVRGAWWYISFITAIILLVCLATAICRRMCQRQAIDKKVNDFMSTYYEGGGADAKNAKEGNEPLLPS